MIAKMHAIKPHPLNDAAMSKELRDSTKQFSEYAIKEFEKVTTGWQGEKPAWKIRYWANQYQIGFQVFPTNENSKGAQKWVWLDLGTKPHEIRAKNASTLAFPSIYQAGSKPGSLRTSPAKSSGPMAFAQVVHHPGTQARDWTKLLQVDTQKVYDKWISSDMARVARASGHSMEK